MGSGLSVGAKTWRRQFRQLAGKKFAQTDQVEDAIFGILNYGDLSEDIAFVTASELKSGKLSFANLTMFQLDHDDVGSVVGKNIDEVVTFVHQYFPGAVESKDVYNGAKVAMKSLGCDEAHTLLAQSLCPDEINHKVGGLLDLFRVHMMGEEFYLGGLAGLPFTGKTGYAAFSGHVPEGGSLFIIFGPHIGVTDTLKLGKFHRIGQSENGAACGAAVGALNYCRNCSSNSSDKELILDFADYQMSFLKIELKKRLDEILRKDPDACWGEVKGEVKSKHHDHNLTAISSLQSKSAACNVCDKNGCMQSCAACDWNICQSCLSLEAADKTENDIQARLVKHVYDISKDFIDCIVDTHQKGRLIVLGGIQINMPPPLKDFFQPLTFEAYSIGEPTVDLMKIGFPSKP